MPFISVFSKRGAPGRSAIALTALVASLAIFALGASGASAYTFSQPFSSATGTGTTGVTISAAVTGSESPITKLTVNESTVLGPNFPAYGSSAQRCPSASMPTSTSAFNPATCPAVAKIGTVTALVGSTTLNGSVYAIDKSPTPWFGVDLGSSFRYALIPGYPQVNPACDPATDPNGFCQQFMQLTTTSFGTNQVKSTKITLGGVSRSPLTSDPFVVSQSNLCSPTIVTKGALKNVAGTTTTINSDMTACQFSPTFSETFASLVAGSNTALTMQWSNLNSPTNMKTVRFDQDQRVSPNFAAFGGAADQCPSSSMPLSSSPFDPSGCPAAAKIGTIELTVPGVSGTVAGTIYTINKSPLSWFGIDVNVSGVTTRFGLFTSFPQVDPTCDPATDPNGYCPTYMRFQSGTLPNIQINTAKLTIGGADRVGSSGVLSGKPFHTEPTNCATPLTSTARFTPFTGNAVTATDLDTMTGC